MKKSLLAKTVVLGLMTATIWSFAGVASAEEGSGFIHYHKNEQIVVTVTGETDGLKDPNLTHPAVGNHTVDCQKQVDDTSLTIGDINKVVDALVYNDNHLQEQINAIEAGAVKGDKGDSIAPGSYKADNDTSSVSMKIIDTDGNKVGDVTITNIATKGNLDAEAQAREAADTTLNNKITQETKDREKADKDLSDRITQEKIDREANDIVSGNIDKSTGEVTLVKGNGTEISVGEICDYRLETATYDSDKGELTLIVKDHYNNDEENQIIVGDIASKEKLETEVEERKAEDARIEQKFDKEVSRLDNRIDKLDDRIEKVGAMSAAIANLHTMGYDPAAPTEIAVGVGQYRDKTGLAVGAFHYPNRDFMMSFSVSTAGDEFMAGIGATWKIGRKSPEQMLKAQQEKAAREKLAEAEAMKQAAKDARVAAQQARHAKMLAERSK